MIATVKTLNFQGMISTLPLVTIGFGGFLASDFHQESLYTARALEYSDAGAARVYK